MVSHKEAVIRTLKGMQHFGSFELRKLGAFHMQEKLGFSLTDVQIARVFYANRAEIEKILGGRFSLKKQPVNGYCVYIERF